VKWAEAGYDPESSSFEKLVMSAECFELSEQIRRTESLKQETHPSKIRSQSTVRPELKTHQTPSRERPLPDKKTIGGHRGSSASSSRNFGQDRRASSSQPQPQKEWRQKLTRTEMDEYRAQGKCFICAQTGHMSKDCPTGNRAKPPASLRTAGISVQKATDSDQNKLKSATKLGLMVIGLDPLGDEWPEDDADDLVDSLEDNGEPDVSEVDETDVSYEHVDRALEKLLAAVPYPYDYFTQLDNPPNNQRRFQIFPWGGGTEYLIADSHTLDEHVIAREQLEDPDFDLISWLVKEKHEIKETLYDGVFRERPMPEAFRLATKDLEWFPVLDRSDQDAITAQLRNDLIFGIPYSFDSTESADLPDVYSPDRFTIEWEGRMHVWVTDHTTNLKCKLKSSQMMDEDFKPYLWLEKIHMIAEWKKGEPASELGPDPMPEDPDPKDPDLREPDPDEAQRVSDHAGSENGNEDDEFEHCTQLLMARLTDRGLQTPHIERNAARVRDNGRVIPRPIIIAVSAEGQPVRALLDSGSLADFISTKLVDQLKLKVEPLAKPMGVQLAVSGSRSKVNYAAQVRIAYQNVDETRHFDIINIDNYDMILRMPFLFQHKILAGLNPTRALIGSDVALPIEGEQTTNLASLATDLMQVKLESLRQELWDYAQDICRDPTEAPLPPL
jgi:hypothetical protein